MDIPEAHITPLDADAEELRSVNIKHLPQELFMIVRVVTLFRGMLVRQSPEALELAKPIP